MTTVAWDGRYLASDGRVCGADGRVLGDRVPKVKISPTGRGRWTATAGAGSEGDLGWHHDWLIKGGREPWPDDMREKNEKGGFEGLELEMWGGGKHKCSWRDDNGRLCTTEAPTTLGSGGAIALGALACGRTAMEAVAVAARWDSGTGGVITYVDALHPELGAQIYEGEKE